MEDFKIKNADVDNGNWVELRGSSFQVSLKKNINVDPVDGQYGKTDYDIAKADRVGIENPIMSVRGYINVNDFKSSDELWNESPSTNTSISEDGVSMAGAVTLGYLHKVWRNMTSQTYLKLTFGDPASSGVNWKSYDNLSTEIPVEIQNIDIRPLENTEGNHIIYYTISFVEVRE